MVATVAPMSELWQMLLRSFSRIRNPERQSVEPRRRLLRKWLDCCSRRELEFIEAPLPTRSDVEREGKLKHSDILRTIDAGCGDQGGVEQAM
jgi:hypothetical protein